MYSEEDRKDLLREAKVSVKSAHTFTLVLAKVLFRREYKAYFFLWYGYFRWVDDQVDAPDRSPEERIRFIEDQRTYLDKCYQGGVDGSSGAREMDYITLLVDLDRSLNCPMKGAIYEMLEAIAFDALRIGRGKPPAKDRFYESIEKEVSAYLKIFHFFCAPEYDTELPQRPVEGIAGKIVHILRDLLEDLDDGVINIPEEDIQAFGIDLDDPCSDSMRRWVHHQGDRAETYFREGKSQLHRYRSLRYKIAVVILCTKYEHILRMVRRQRFVPSRELPETRGTRLLFASTLLINLGRVVIKHLLLPFRRRHLEI